LIEEINGLEKYIDKLNGEKKKFKEMKRNIFKKSVKREKRSRKPGPLK
jgi:hypothetical protein